MPPFQPEQNQPAQIVPPRNKNNFLLPLSIIIAGVLIAAAIFINRAPSQENNSANKQMPVKDIPVTLTDSDHVLGNKDAKLTLVEFSDLECPFCKRYEATMQQVMDKYEKDGTVKWVYKHFPLDKIHSKTRKEMEATECANELGGNQKFWDYMNKVYEVTPSNNGLDPAKLPEIASQVGLDKTKFNACLSSGKYASKIEDDYQQGVKAGVNGTPDTIFVAQKAISKAAISTLSDLNNTLKQQSGSNSDFFTISPDKTKISVSGAMPFEIVDQIIQTMVK